MDKAIRGPEFILERIEVRWTGKGNGEAGCGEQTLDLARLKASQLLIVVAISEERECVFNDDVA